MGTAASTQCTHGTLKGAYPPPISSSPATPVPNLQFSVAIPYGHRAGETLTVTIDGRKHSLAVPANMKYGDRMEYEIPDVRKVYASTLHALPGMAIVVAKPIVFGSVSYAFQADSSGISGQLSMGQQVGRLMQEAQDEVLQQAARMGCNAALGMAFTVTNDSSGDYGRSKLVIVTACGTPCVIIPQSEHDTPVIQATAVVVPMYIDGC
jgi:uncharacterized protein YbjQ (UPF0145 family)